MLRLANSLLGLGLTAALLAAGCGDAASSNVSNFGTVNEPTGALRVRLDLLAARELVAAKLPADAQRYLIRLIDPATDLDVIPPCSRTWPPARPPRISTFPMCR